MTEAEWQKCNDWRALFTPLPDRVSIRKFRLFSAACCRRIWGLMPDCAKDVVELAEKWVDKQASESEVLGAIDACQRVRLDAMTQNAVAAVGWFTDKEIGRSTHMIAGNAACCVPMCKMPQGPRNDDWESIRRQEDADQTPLLRDIFPNPFRPAPTFDPAWLRWHDGTIPRLAQQMYDTRDFSRMPILADALEEAGCTSGDILEHCRGTGPHVRGCWVVDLVLGKD